jgi:small subunit ribosomal protein S4
MVVDQRKGEEVNMAKYTGPKCKLCRREGTKLFLKGTRCYSEKCAMNKRNFPPGQHGTFRRRQSDYSRHLREKQKVKRIYGILEAQFRRYFYDASKKKGVTGFMLLQSLERRLDNVVYLGGIADSRNKARQIVGQGKVKVNGKEITIPSYQIDVKDKVSSVIIESTPKAEESMPAWITWDKSKKELIVERLPLREDINPDINEQLIVEFYSR